MYYYLLLTGRFQYSIKETWDRIHYQFPSDLATDPATWKTHELWPPSGPGTRVLEQSSGPNLFLNCNPLSGYYNRKDPNIYNQPSPEDRPDPDSTYKILLYTDLHLQIRMAWEKRAYWFTNSGRESFRAPTCNREYIRWILQSGVEFNGIMVDPRIPNIIEYYKPEKIVRLQDFIVGPSNADQKKFLDHWINLQPKKALRFINKSTICQNT